MEILVEKIKKDIEYLFIKHQLQVEVIKVSPLVYIELQKGIIKLINRGICYFKYQDPLKIDGIPVVIDENIYMYELVVNISALRLEKSDK